MELDPAPHLLGICTYCTATITATITTSITGAIISSSGASAGTSAVNTDTTANSTNIGVGNSSESRRQEWSDRRQRRRGKE